MTRAKDTLAIYANQGTGKKIRGPPSSCASSWATPLTESSGRPAPAAAVQDDLFAEAEEDGSRIEHSNVAAWLLMEPPAELCHRPERVVDRDLRSSVRCASNWNASGTCRAMCPPRCTTERPCTACCVRSTMPSAIEREISDDELLEQFRVRPGRRRHRRPLSVRAVSSAGEGTAARSSLEWARTGAAARGLGDGAQIRTAGWGQQS